MPRLQPRVERGKVVRRLGRPVGDNPGANVGAVLELDDVIRSERLPRRQTRWAVAEANQLELTLRRSPGLLLMPH